MKRGLFSFRAPLLLATCAAAVLLWLSSYWRGVFLTRPIPDDWTFGFVLCRGGITLNWASPDESGIAQPLWSRGWHAETFPAPEMLARPQQLIFLPPWSISWNLPGNMPASAWTERRSRGDGFVRASSKTNWARAGFVYEKDLALWSDLTANVYCHNLLMPAWVSGVFVLGCGAAEGLVLRRRFRRWWRASRGRCIHCGYDLLATPARCPECGAAARTLH